MCMCTCMCTCMSLCMCMCKMWYKERCTVEQWRYYRSTCAHTHSALLWSGLRRWRWVEMMSVYNVAAFATLLRCSYERAEVLSISFCYFLTGRRASKLTACLRSVTQWQCFHVFIYDAAIWKEEWPALISICVVFFFFSFFLSLGSNLTRCTWSWPASTSRQPCNTKK